MPGLCRYAVADRQKIRADNAGHAPASGPRAPAAMRRALRGFTVEQVMHPQRLHNRVPHRMARIERRIRIPEYKLNIPAHRLQFTVRERVDALTVEGDAPSCDATSLSSARPVVDLPQPDSPPAPAFRPARDQN